MMGSYLPSTPQEREQMLQAIGLQNADGLYADVPSSVLLKKPVDIPQGLSEMEVRAKMADLAGQNTVYPVVLRGAGAYDHFIPAIVGAVTAKEEFSTAYTPYQAELSQGILQSIFEFQTMICELTGMDAANASVYDGASAAAEACMMCLERKRNRVIVSGSVHPDVLETIRTYCWGRDVRLEVVPARKGVADVQALRQALGEDAACVYFQQPNFFGLLEPVEEITAAAHQAGAKAIAGVYPTALGALKAPGEYGADIAVGEGQPLGMPLSFGGPYLGFMAAKREHMRLLPGRIVGKTQDSQGRQAFVLTLQAREQHIRREKAGSNVCSNQALCAMTAAVYMAAMGPQGLERAALLSYQNAHELADKLGEIPGCKLVYPGEFFNEFLMTCPVKPEKIEKALGKAGILSGLPMGEHMLWCVTEKLTQQQLEQAVQAVREVADK